LFTQVPLGIYSDCADYSEEMACNTQVIVASREFRRKASILMNLQNLAAQFLIQPRWSAAFNSFAAPTAFPRWTILCAATLLTCSLHAQDEFPSSKSWQHSAEPTQELNGGLISDSFAAKRHIDDLEQAAAPVQPASLLQSTPLVLPRPDLNASPLTRMPSSANSRETLAVSNLLDTVRGMPRTGDRISSSEGASRASRDLGDLLQKSPAALSVGTQSRTPIVHDPRIRGSRVGSLAASGSHWIAARADLDTILSKFDSRQVESVEIIPGPFTSLLGPGFDFTDVQLLQSPRFSGGQQWHGATDADYRSNGNQFFGQQSVLTGGEDWGARLNYGYRTGDDYAAGNGLRIPSSYNSQEMTVALGKDWREQSIEFSLLRLDQDDVEFPGYVFDIDNLVTDGYQVTHQLREAGPFDAIETQSWYNRTFFNGNSQNPAKRVFFPLLDQVNYVGRTDVDALSTGYRQSFVRSESDQYRFTIGHDLRYTAQELNEVSSGTFLGLPLPFSDRNSPIPKSFSANPGLFTEFEYKIFDEGLLRLGGRVDYARSDITEDPANLQSVGLQFFPASYAEIVGTDQFARDFHLLSAFAKISSTADGWTNTLGIGFAERAPNFTELYAAQPFMLLLQNGLNNVTGDPTLKTEKLLQFDAALEYTDERVQAGVRGFQSWGFDYLTFENTQVNLVPPAGEVGQVSLRYVNTDLATLTGFETFAALLPSSPLSPFVNMRYVQGKDRTRGGNFATTNGSQGDPSRKIPGLVRGFFSGVLGGESEPLPGISPLETRVGLRYQDSSVLRRWSLELSSRIVENQSRVATSLLETPSPGFTTWDLRGVFRPGGIDGLMITMGVENFTDKLYREHLDFRTQSGISIYQPGTTFYLGSSLTY
jgi:iron complex outermembrane recepter protein